MSAHREILLSVDTRAAGEDAPGSDCQQLAWMGQLTHPMVPPPHPRVACRHLVPTHQQHTDRAAQQARD